jgi:acyl-CoA oxidase
MKNIFRNLGYQATHAVVYAQLYTKNTCHGLHPFVVPIR